MGRYRVFVIGVSLFLASCATNFSAHLESSIKTGEVSELGMARRFVVVDTEGSSKKIKYSYGEIPAITFEYISKNAFEIYASKNYGLYLPPKSVEPSNYPEYIKNQEHVVDSATKKLISRKLVSIGMTEAEPNKNQDVLLLSYQELMGWDMGEIVKEMRICGRVESLSDRYMDCAEFSELKFANSHPTRELIINNLIAILLTKSWPKDAPVDKYKKNHINK
jgi:hypothetical protein